MGRTPRWCSRCNRGEAGLAPDYTANLRCLCGVSAFGVVGVFEIPLEPHTRKNTGVKGG